MVKSIPIYVKYVLYLGFGLLTACFEPPVNNALDLSKTNRVSGDTQIPVEIAETRKAETSAPPAENNYGYESQEELRNATLLVHNALENYAFVAIVRDIKVTYPEWPFGNPVDPDDGFVSGVQRYEVSLVEALRGELPHNFSYNLYTESANVVIRDNPYPVGFCYSKTVKGFVAKVFLGRMFDDPRFVKLFLAEWDKAEPVDLSD